MLFSGSQWCDHGRPHSLALLHTSLTSAVLAWPGRSDKAAASRDQLYTTVMQVEFTFLSSWFGSAI